MEIRENFKEFKVIKSFQPKDLQKIQEEINGFYRSKYKKDVVNIDIYSELKDEFFYNKAKIVDTDIKSITKVIDENHIDEEDNLKLTLTIKKNNFSIYSMENFLQHIKSLEFNHIINNFNIYTQINTDSLYIVQDNIELKSTLFGNSNKDIDRKKYIKQMGDVVNTFGFPSHFLLPNDFDFNYMDITQKNKNITELIDYLKKLKGLLSLFFLSEFIELENNNITIKINNTYNLNAHFNFANFSFSSNKDIDELYKVYRWVYNNENKENILEKLELARIQIAKNLTFENNCFKIKTENIMSNLRSMYKIYLKENVDKYIEATNKVAEIISQMIFRQNEIISSFTNSLKTNSILLISFFISLVVYNNLAAGKTSVFNESNFLLVFLFTIISVSSLCLSYRQVKQNLNRAIKYYNKQKEIYEHLFSKDDIEQLFSNEYIDTMENNVTNDLKLYTKVWIFELILIFSISGIVTYIKEISKFINIIIDIVSYYN